MIMQLYYDSQIVFDIGQNIFCGFMATFSTKALQIFPTSLYCVHTKSIICSNMFFKEDKMTKGLSFVHLIWIIATDLKVLSIKDNTVSRAILIEINIQ